MRSAVRTSVPAPGPVGRTAWARLITVTLKLPTDRDCHGESPPSPNLEASAHAKAAVTGTDLIHRIGEHWPTDCDPQPREPEEREPGCAQQDWQHEACSMRMGFPRAGHDHHDCFRENLAQIAEWPRSGSGPGAGGSLRCTFQHP